MPFKKTKIHFCYTFPVLIQGSDLNQDPMELYESELKNCINFCLTHYPISRL